MTKSELIAFLKTQEIVMGKIEEAVKKLVIDCNENNKTIREACNQRLLKNGTYSGI